MMKDETSLYRMYLGVKDKKPSEVKAQHLGLYHSRKESRYLQERKDGTQGGLDRKSVGRAQPNMVDHRQGSGRDHLNMVDRRLESGSTVSLKNSARFKFWKNKVSVNKLLKTTKVVIQMEGKNYNNKKLRSCIFYLKSPGDGGRLPR